MKPVVRDVEPEDMPFIYATWLRGLYHGNPWWRDVDQDTFFSEYHKVIERILSALETTVQVSCLEEDPNVVIGYSVSRGSVLDWVFVKKAFRKFGIAKTLIPDSINTVTHLTKMGKICKPDAWKFNPFK